ncbi:MAG: radical SAM protein [Firmicutes bacterium]|nr:radical SAM protein [Bacillota bacterium]
MKNVYFVQAGNLYGVNAYLPYAAGCVAAYAWSNPLIRENYRLDGFSFLREPVAQAAASFKDPFLVAFSNYLWNFEYHKALAKEIKRLHPGCLIVFGGHQVLNESAEQLGEYPFVDLLIHKAGEIPFEQLLLALLQGADFAVGPSLSYRDTDGNPRRTREALCESCDFPSPYLTGMFDRLFETYPDILFSMTIESNRGCPYSCAFCDWGTQRQKLLQISMERVKAEIDWAALHKIEFVVCADGNFGMLERDEEIVDYVIETKRRTGYPKKFNACFAKNGNEIVFRLNQKLSEQGISNGATVAFQSLSPLALENVGRSNLGLKQLHELVSLYNHAGIPVYTELIMGLPGETLDSFVRGLGTLLAAGMHGAIEVYPCELLPNAALSGATYMEKHGIEGIRVRQTHRHGSPANHDEVPEYCNIVRKTNTMPTEDWITAFLFATVIQGYHGFGLLTCFAVYLYCARKLPYERFYLDLIGWAEANPATLAGEQLSFIRERYRSLSQGTGESLVYYDSRFGEVTWPLCAALFLRTAMETPRFFDELPAFLRRYGMDVALLSQLAHYQRTILRLPGPPPAPASFDYDFPGYFAAAFAGRYPNLLKKRTTVRFTEQRAIDSWPDYARECVWYGRRKRLSIREGEAIYG